MPDMWPPCNSHCHSNRISEYMGDNFTSPPRLFHHGKISLSFKHNIAVIFRKLIVSSYLLDSILV